MKKRTVKILIGLNIFIILTAAYITLMVKESNASQTQPIEIISGYLKPLILTPQEKYQNTKVQKFDFDIGWQAKTNQQALAIQPQTNGQAAMLVNLSNDQILYSKNISEQRPIASLVKIMTATIALEHKNTNEVIRITRKAADIGENSMGLTVNEEYTLEELLYGLMLNSGNDAAYAIAQGTAGDVKTFVTWMNIKAGELGLENTYFADPSGLNNESYSTPQDLVKLTKYAMQNPEFRKIVGTVEQNLVGEEHKNVYLYNQTNLLTTYPGVLGVKTGYTAPAGLCLITYAENNGVELVGVVLNSIDRKGDMILMLDHGFAFNGINIVHNLL